MTPGIHPKQVKRMLMMTAELFGRKSRTERQDQSGAISAAATT